MRPSLCTDEIQRASCLIKPHQSRAIKSCQVVGQTMRLTLQFALYSPSFSWCEIVITFTSSEPRNAHLVFSIQQTDIKWKKMVMEQARFTLFPFPTLQLNHLCKTPNHRSLTYLASTFGVNCHLWITDSITQLKTFFVRWEACSQCGNRLQMQGGSSSPNWRAFTVATH